MLAEKEHRNSAWLKLSDCLDGDDERIVEAVIIGIENGFDDETSEMLIPGPKLALMVNVLYEAFERMKATLERVPELAKEWGTEHGAKWPANTAAPE
jgi:hypothetical protein